MRVLSRDFQSCQGEVDTFEWTGEYCGEDVAFNELYLMHVTMPQNESSMREDFNLLECPYPSAIFTYTSTVRVCLFRQVWPLTRMMIVFVS